MSETPNEGAGGVSVEGHDEKRVEWLLGRTQGRWQVLDGDAAYLTAVEMTVVVPKSLLDAALVESEARERELEEARDREATNCTLWRHDCEQARNERAVLVEALKDAIAGLERVRDNPVGGDGWLHWKTIALVTLLDLCRFDAALAEVVEAEPDDLAQEHRDLNADAAYEASEGKYGRPLAEPDGSERA